MKAEEVWQVHVTIEMMVVQQNAWKGGEERAERRAEDKKRCTIIRERNEGAEVAKH